MLINVFDEANFVVLGVLKFRTSDAENK